MISDIDSYSFHLFNLSSINALFLIFFPSLIILFIGIIISIKDLFKNIKLDYAILLLFYPLSFIFVPFKDSRLYEYQYLIVQFVFIFIFIKQIWGRISKLTKRLITILFIIQIILSLFIISDVMFRSVISNPDELKYAPDFKYLDSKMTRELLLQNKMIKTLSSDEMFIKVANKLVDNNSIIFINYGNDHNQDTLISYILNRNIISSNDYCQLKNMTHNPYDYFLMDVVSEDIIRCRADNHNIEINPSLFLEEEYLVEVNYAKKIHKYGIYKIKNDTMFSRLFLNYVPCNKY
jgi:hypothetical protein